MPRRKKIKRVEEKIKPLNEQIAETVAELSYMSETDAPIVVFAGQQTDVVTAENLLFQLNRKSVVKIEEKAFSEFFAPLIKVQDWFGEEERKMTEKFVSLKDLLQTNLIQKKVFRLGKKDIDIFVVGLDGNNILRGIQTRAVET